MRVSAPAKLILFGEWAVTLGGTAVGTCLEPRFLLEHKASQDFFCDFCGVVDQKSAELFFQRVLESLKQESRGVWQTRMEFRADEGLGSSSALIACAAKVRHPKISEHELWLSAQRVIREVQNPKASAMDAGLQIFGGSQVLRHKDQWQGIQLSRPNGLEVIHTGQKISTAEALAKTHVTNNWAERVSESVERFLVSRDWKQAIEDHWSLLKEAGLVAETWRARVDQWIQWGWILAGKTTGAGGGDALLVLINPAQRREFEAEMGRLGYWVSKAGWESPGLRIEQSV
jgi:mevalonate kinase